MKKRLWVVLLALVMALRLLPATARADGEWTEVSSAEDLRNALQTGGNIRLTANVSVTSTIEIADKTVTLDLNGTELTGPSSNTLFRLNGNATLVIMDSSSGSGQISLTATGVYLNDTSTFELAGGMIARNGAGNVIIGSGNGCTIKISGCTINHINAANYDTVTIGRMNGTTGANPGHFIMTGGEIYSSGFAVGVTYGSINISGGTIEAGTVALLYNGGPEEGYTSTVSGGKITVPGNIEAIAIQLLYGNLTINGETEIIGGGAAVSNGSGNLTVAGNAQITSIYAGGSAISNQTNENADNPGIVNIQAGTITGYVSTWGEAETTISGGTVIGYVYADSTDSNVKITGGNFSSDVSNYVADGMEYNAETGDVVINTETARGSGGYRRIYFPSGGH